MACLKLFAVHLICKVFGVTLLARHLRWKVVAVLDLKSCISNFLHVPCFEEFHTQKNLQ